jgi:pimeloyl-ACP methyl ester carboxylesterase
MKAFLVTLVWLSLLTSCTKDDASTEQHVEGYIAVNGKKLYYEKYGHGMPLLLLSGGGINRSIEDFRKCIPKLAEQFTVIAVDTPGQGKSEQLEHISYGILAETMSAFIDSLKIDSVYVIGWSDGAIAGIMLAQSQSKVRRVIAVGPNNGKKGFDIPPGIPLDSVVAPSAEIFERLNKDEVAKYSQTPGRDWKRMVHDYGLMVYAEEYFSPELYGKINIPVMIVLGDRDMITIEHGHEMARAIKNAQFCVLPNTTHEVFAERPEWINQIAFDFFQTNR